VLRRYADVIAFSGRATGTFSFASFISDAGLRRVVLNMGGHAKAMGGAFAPERLDDFTTAVRVWERSTQGQAIWANTAEPPAPPHELDALSSEMAFALARTLGPFGHRFRRPVYQTTLRLRAGIAYSGSSAVEANAAIADGVRVAFTFDEAQCDGQRIGIDLLPFDV
jgi:hypothetical protein